MRSTGPPYGPARATIDGVSSRTALLVALVLGALAVLVGAVPAQAAAREVTLMQDGPNGPSGVRAGDTVAFRNEDDVEHRVRSTTSHWTGDVRVPVDGSFPVRLGPAGTYGFRDSYTAPDRIVGLLPAPTEKTSSFEAAPPAGPRPTQTTPSPSPSQTAPPPGLTGGPGSGDSVTGGTGGTEIALPPPGTAPGTSTAAPDARLTEALVQPASLRRYGVPTGLGLVLVLGVASLIVRVAVMQEPRRTA